MTVDELFAELTKRTKLKNGRDRVEFHQLRSEWPNRRVDINDTFVDEMLHLLEVGSYLDQVALLERMTNELPHDVMTVINENLILRPAFNVLMRKLHETKTIYQTARQAFLEGYTNGAEDALKTGQDEAISDEHAKQGFERWWRTQAISTHRPSS